MAQALTSSLPHLASVGVDRQSVFGRCDRKTAEQGKDSTWNFLCLYFSDSARHRGTESLAGTSVQSLGQGDRLQGWRVSQRQVGNRGEAKLEMYRVGK